MSTSNGESRSPKFGQVAEDGKLKRESRCLGVAARTSGRHGFNEVATSGDDSYRRDTVASEQWGDYQTEGKVVDQLADELEEEISYHESEVHDLEKEILSRKSKVYELKSRLKYVRQLSGELEKPDSSD